MLDERLRPSPHTYHQGSGLSQVLYWPSCFQKLVPTWPRHVVSGLPAQGPSVVEVSWDGPPDPEEVMVLGPRQIQGGQEVCTALLRATRNTFMSPRPSISLLNESPRYPERPARTAMPSTLLP